MRPKKEQQPQGNRPDPGPPTDPPRELDPAPASPGPAPSDPAAATRSGARSGIPLRAEPRVEDRSAVTANPLRVETQEPLVVPGPQPARRLPPVRAIARATPSPDGGDRLPPIVVVGAALLGLGAAAATWWVLHRRGPALWDGVEATAPRPHPPVAEQQKRDLLVEAELQELIAEERARDPSRDAAGVTADRP